MKRISRLCLLAGLCLAFVVAQTPVQAVAAQSEKAKSPVAQTLETVVVRLGNSTKESSKELDKDLELLTPEEVAMLSANPRMMSVGGRYHERGEWVANEALIILAVTAGVILVVLIVVLASER